MSAAPKPLAEGSLTSTPFGHVLLSIMKKRLSGTLAVWPDDDRPGQDRIRFENGVPTAARFLEPTSHLERGILAIFQRENAPYAFYEADLVGDREGTIRGSVDPFHAVAAALRANAPAEAVNRVLIKLGEDRQRIRQGAPLARFSLLPTESAFVDFMRAEPATAKELVTQFGDPEVARRMIYLFGITDSLEIYDRPISQQKLKALSSNSSIPVQREAPPSVPLFRSTSPSRRPGSIPPEPSRSSSPAPGSISRDSLSGEVVAPRKKPPPPPEGLDEDLRKHWDEVGRVVGMLDRQNYFEMLGVKESSDANEVRSRYMQLAKKWHPDRLPEPLAPLRPWVEEIFHLYTLARDTLADKKQLAEYQKTVMQGGGTPEAERKINMVVEAALEFQKVDVLVRRRQYDQALQIVDRAMQTVTKEADYPAMKAWILLLRDGIDDTDVLNQIRECLRTVFKLNPDHVHGHFVRAHVLKRLGNYDKALAHFKKVAQLDPKNLDALREVRVAKMRHAKGRSTAPPPSITGKRASLFGGLFGGKKK